MIDLPLISCIMPTAARPDFAARAVARFFRQTWPYKELLILDDATRLSFIYPPPGCVYWRSITQTLGAKRNELCARAAGDVICHWDDDDISGDDRLSHQIAVMMQNNASIIGYNPMLFMDESAGWWRYHSIAPGYVLGTSLMYRKDVWSAAPFKADQHIGEDGAFLTGKAGVVGVPGDLHLVATIHCGNSSPREIRPPLWTRLMECDL